ncbi:MAG TPA: hypothetical protein VH879_07965 [Gemmatimonadales bacterium]|jgi:hypothetical protein
MDIEGILAIVLIFGGGAAIAISFSPVGRALADRIRGRSVPAADPEVYEELERIRAEMSELQERVDFTERLLAKSRERDALPGADS